MSGATCTNTGTISYSISGSARYYVVYCKSKISGQNNSYVLFKGIDYKYVGSGGNILSNSNGLTCLYFSDFIRENLQSAENGAKEFLRQKLLNQKELPVIGYLSAAFADLKAMSQIGNSVLSFVFGGDTNLGCYSKTIDAKASVTITVKIKETYNYKCFEILPDCENVKVEILSVKYS
jgi:hypothetical protein